MPGVLDADSDYSEKGSIVNARQIQSEYWVQKTYTLFISIWTYLCTSTWVDRCSALDAGQPVTVEPEGLPLDACGSLDPSSEAFYAEVEIPCSSEGEQQLYTVRSRDGTLFDKVPRYRLRARKRRTIAFACVTNEKRQDAPTTQHFLNRILNYFRGVPTAAPASPPPAAPAPPYQFDNTQTFRGLVHHSDNASHFKSNKMLHYWSTVREEAAPIHPAPRLAEEQRLSTLWVEFGCAGHGKGPWDGLGAMLKQTVRRDVLHNTVLTASGYITSPEEVAEHLYHRFSTVEWREAHLRGRINDIVILYSNATDIQERAVVEKHSYSTLEMQKQTFSYFMLAPGVHGRRQLSCFCTYCFNALGRGQGSMDSNMHVRGCKNAGKHQYIFHEQECKRSDAAGIAERRKAAQREGHRIASKLEPGMWLAAQDRMGDEGILIGQAFRVPASNYTCIHKKIEVRDERIAGTQFGRGDYAIAVRWWVKTCDDPEERTYEEWHPSLEDTEAYGVETASGTYFLVNSTELRLANFAMDAVNPLPFTPVSRRTRGAVAAPERPDTRGRRFRLPVEVENQILALCRHFVGD